MPPSTQQQQASHSEARTPHGPWGAGIGAEDSGALISGERIPAELVAAMALVKRACLNAGLDATTTDVFPTALRVATGDGIANNLLPALTDLREALGHRHEAGALEPTASLAHACDAIASALPAVYQLTVHERCGDQIAGALAKSLNLPLRHVHHPVTTIPSATILLTLHGALKAAALALMPLCADLRRSAEPHDEQPTQCDALTMVCCQVLGNDVALTIGAATGQFEGRAFKPLLAHNLLQSIRLLTDSTTAFTEYFVRKGTPLREPIAHGLASSLMLVTSRVAHAG